MASVAIVGAGWAGIACAIAAAKAGARVDVYERRAGVDEGATYVDVVPDMMRSLSRLGVADACARDGFPYRSVVLSDASGRLHDEIPCIRLAAPHLPVAAGLRSAVLTKALRETALAHGVRIHESAGIDTVSFDHGHAVLHVCDGGRVSADLTLLATGDDGTNRGAALSATTAAERVTWWCGLVQRPPGLDQPRIVLAGLRSKLWLSPLSGVTAGMSLIDDGLQALGQESLTATQVRGWLQRHACRPEWISALSHDEVVLRPLRVHAGLKPLPWHQGNLLCVGAAAHGFPPHFSQPAAQAFEDAVVLGELLAEHPRTTALLDAFVRRRQPRVRAVFEVAVQAMTWDRDPNHGAGLAALAGAMASAVAAPA